MVNKITPILSTTLANAGTWCNAVYITAPITKSITFPFTDVSGTVNECSFPQSSWIVTLSDKTTTCSYTSMTLSAYCSSSNCVNKALPSFV